MSDTNLYESSTLLDQYLLFHYGDPAVIMPHEFGPQNGFNFPVRLLDELLDNDDFAKQGRVPEVGCAVGRTSFELSKVFDEVIGIDFSHSFINAANELKAKQTLDYKVLEEGTYIFRCSGLRCPKELNRRIFPFSKAMPLTSMTIWANSILWWRRI